jgi:transcriptional regulator with XRE-family HTH domain
MEEELLYQMIGEKIRTERRRVRPELSQAGLAKKLDLSRASIVNIELGKQRAPIHVLWQIAEALKTDIGLLLPRRDELDERNEPIKLDAKTIRQIEVAAQGDAATRRDLTQFISKAKSKSHETEI